jgi:hypothetical protein
MVLVSLSGNVLVVELELAMVRMWEEKKEPLLVQNLEFVKDNVSAQMTEQKMARQ